MHEYLKERLLSAGLFCTVIVVFFIVHRNSKSEKQQEWILRAYLLVLTILGFLYVPSSGADVSRLVYAGNEYAAIPFGTFIRRAFTTSATPLAQLYFRLVQSLHIQGAMSGITAFLSFMLYFSSVKLVAKNYKFSNKCVAYAVLFSMCGGLYFAVVAGIRFILATLILVRGLLSIWFGEKQYLPAILSIVVACLIHTGMIPLVVFWLASLCLSRGWKRRLWLYALLAIVCVFAIGIISRYISVAFDKYEGYSGSGALKFGVYRYVLALFHFAIYVYFMFYLRRTRKIGILPKGSGVYLVLLTCFELFLIRDFIMFARYLCLYPFLLLPHLMSYVNTSELKGLRQYETNFLFICVVCLITNYLSDMSGLKFFVLN